MKDWTLGDVKDWTQTARARLLGWQTAGGGWGYRPDATPYAEVTALAVLALCAYDEGVPDAARAGARWLETLQSPDGSVGLTPDLREPSWCTPLAALAWMALEEHPGAQDRALAWLARQAGVGQQDPEGLVGHDPTLSGWPWVDDTSAWLEPTAWAVLALARSGGAPERVRHGVALILDRAIPTGGWNYGNPVVLDTVLRPQPAPTGLALLALACAGAPPDPRIRAALAFLQAELPDLGAPQSLALGLLGLSAWQASASAAAPGLEGAFDQSLRRPDPVLQTAYLLLGGSPRACRTLGGDALEARLAPRPPVASDVDAPSPRSMRR